MPTRVALRHRTAYRYDRPVALGPQVVRLRPAPHCRTPVVAYSLNVTPAGHFLNWQQDPHGNFLARLVFPKPVREFTVEVGLVAEMTVLNPFDFFVEPSAETVPFVYDSTQAAELAPYLVVEPPGPMLTLLVTECLPSGRMIDFLVKVNRLLQQRVRYLVRMEPGVQSPEETLTLESGSCRDSAWLLVQLFRHLGMAARFASGYLIQLMPDEKPLDGPVGPASDFTDLHAWAEVYIPGAGWIGLDPTSGLLCGEGHIPLACAADPASAAPISGGLTVVGGEKLKTDFEFHMSVERVRETPRATKPYTAEQWEAIDRLGKNVDTNLIAGDVRLTMGGEPTFVSVDDREGAEWKTAALGPLKRQRAGELLRRLAGRFAPGHFLHFGQGKWYPGEQLPRWSLGCYWRRDGVPVWRNPALIAADDHDYAFVAEDARRFITALAERLGVNPYHAMPGYEDAAYYLLREQRLPVNVDPTDSRVDDPEERTRLSRVFDSGLSNAVGFALPLRKNGAGWETGVWSFRRGHLCLLPGDSPMGYRLPLDSLPWEAPHLRQAMIEPDPAVNRPPLPVTRRVPTKAAEPPRSEIVRTALCVEPRGGTMKVFLPPQDSLEDFLALIEAVEATAARLQMPVQVEGYTPPRDARLLTFQVTPDPGVIEVNVQPAADWGELTDITTTLYDEAKKSRLTADKFMTDGRAVGTGGGNHLVVGGATTTDSPFLRRPHLLRSLLGYWHNHPSLSYLFAGLFVGPTSQAPRLDEARNDSVYELELAFRQLPDDGPCPPWLVDRALRHLLTDVTGNTHRSEFCIDKLYNPDSTSGRLGLLELRAFEMPPHPQMSLVQQLLVRTLIARFWDEPYREPLVRWGPTLHDRFALPHYLMADFRDVAADTRRRGFDLRAEWFEPHYEFRFPKIGEIAPGGVKLELRHALEPWHVLGEEGMAGGTVRYVDSSVERVQVLASGWTDPRFVLACNGRRVPLHPTGTGGEAVAGVRFRAWQPPSCLHPTIPVHAPLVFELIDTWQNQSLGGCTYHVAHPGGRSFDTSPVNAAEAESRRNSRFFPDGYSTGKVVVPPAEVAPECPFTLDLRTPRTA